MPFDGFVTRAVEIDLNNKIKGAKINNIYQHSPHDISLLLRAYKKNYTLLISAHPVFCRVHLTENKYKNPEYPPSFCMLLRKYLKGGVIKEVRQVEGDRILDLYITQKDEYGLEKETMLTVEIMGKHSNVILVDKNKKRILDGLKKIKREFSDSKKREIFPGTLFERPPEQKKSNPWENEFEPDELLNLIKYNSSKNLTTEEILFNYYQGISLLLSKELAYRSSIIDLKLEKLESNHIMKLLHNLSKLKEDLTKGNIEPMILKNTKKDKIDDFYLFPLKHSSHLWPVKTNHSLTEILDEFYTQKEEEEKKLSLEKKIKGKVNSLIKKNKKKLKKQEKELEESENAQKYKIYGELLTANLYRFTSQKPHEDKIEVPNYYKDPPENTEIKLDQSLTPSENAQRYFKKYQKAKKRKEKLKKEINKTRTNIKYLENISFHLETAENLQEFEAIDEELKSQGYINKDKEKKESKKAAKKAASKESMPLKFTSSEGFQIWVGKNNKQNDYLTLKMASPEDTWLHTKEIAGSHVIIRGKNIPTSTLEEAASLAAYYSRGRYSNNVPVDYTKIKHVRKPRGAKPGMVIYDNHKTLFVKPTKPFE